MIRILVLIKKWISSGNYRVKTRVDLAELIRGLKLKSKRIAYTF